MQDSRHRAAENTKTIFSNENQTFQFSTYQDHQSECRYQHDDSRIKRFRFFIGSQDLISLEIIHDFLGYQRKDAKNCEGPNNLWTQNS